MLALLALVVAGALWKVIQKSPPPPPPPPGIPGERIDVGGYSLYIECAGSGSPTVILETGQGGFPGGTPSSPGFLALTEVLASETRVCAYDRAGLGASDPRPAALVPTGARFSNELRTLLANANVPGPYVVVGASYGGLLAVSHGIRYSSDFVGFVFVDARPTPWDIAPGVDVFGPPEPLDVSGELDALQAVQFGSRPVLVLIAESLEGRELARRSSNSMVLTTPGIGHAIFFEAPQLPVEATRLVVTAVRTSAMLPPCERTPLPQVGGECE